MTIQPVGREHPNQLQTEPQHGFVMSFVTTKVGTGRRRSTNGKLFNVRCKCMAEYRDVSDRYFCYEPLGQVTSLEEACRLYREHLAESARKAA